MACENLQLSPGPGGQRESPKSRTALVRILIGAFLLFVALPIYASQGRPSGPVQAKGPSVHRNAVDPRSREEYYYFVAELHVGASPESVSRDLSVDLVRELEVPNSFLFREYKPANSTNAMMRDEILGRMLRYGHGNATAHPTIYRKSEIKSLDLLPKRDPSRTLSRRSESSSAQEAYDKLVEKLGFKDPGLKYQWHLVRPSIFLNNHVRSVKLLLGEI